MTLTRRSVLAGGAACLVAPWQWLGAASPVAPQAARGTAPAPDLVLTPGPATLQLAPPDYPATDVWAYNGAVPGPELRLKQGAEFSARLTNGLSQDTTIHWHGVRLPIGMDGVPGASQAPVQPGGSFDYHFTLRDAGTFWYHPHMASAEQVARGLSGPLIVEEADAPDIDADVTLVLDDWRMTETAQIHDSFGAFHDLSHAGRLGNYVTVNGRDDWTRAVHSGARLRLRLVNTATARVFRLRPRDMVLWVVALDGMPLETPQIMDELVLGPAQRIDVMADIQADPNGEALLASVERDASFVVAAFPTGPKARAAARPAPRALPPNALPALDLKRARKVALVMDGGAMRGLSSARYKGQQMDMRALATAGQFWAFNGQAGMSDAPLADVAVGETLRIGIENRTAFAHAQHLHGHHFRAVEAEGHLGPWRDTILVAQGETREIAFTAEEPGDWMFHCHMLSHQMAGMMTWIRVI